MNVLQILPELNIGGVERGTVDLAKYLMANDHKAVVVSGGGRLVRELDMIGARHYRLPVGRKSLFTMVNMVRRLCDIIKRENIDIVHARSRVPAWIAFFACKITKTPFITTAHGYYKNIFTSQVMGWAKFVIVASHIIARHMIDDFEVPRSKIRLIPRGVDLLRFSFKDPKEKRSQPLHAGTGFTIGVISRLTPIKGHTYLIKAVSVVSRIVPKLRVLIVGEPSPGREGYMSELELLVKRLGLSRIVEFTGWKEDIPEALSQLDLLVLPTITQEAFGRVIVEAQACGVPVIATKVGGIVDLIEDGVNGLLVQAEDVHSLKEAILKIAKDADLAQHLAIAGRKSAEERFSLDEMARKTVLLYKEAIESVNILVIKISALGDVILSVPSIRAIRSKFPGANIKVLVGLKSRRVFKGCPYINEVIVCDFKGKDKSIRRLFKLGSILRNSNFDMVIDLQNNTRSHILAFLSLAPLRFGYNNGKLAFLLNKRVEGPKEYLDPVSHQFRTLNLAGIKSDDKRLELWPQDEEEVWADNFIKDNWVDLSKQRLVGINPKASRRWVSKSWPLINVASLCDELARRLNTRVVITGTKEDLKDVQDLRLMTKSKPVIASGKTNLLQLAALIKRCSVFITTDSATMHIASCMNTPFIALFGPTEPERHVPVSAEHIVIKHKMKCSPCYKPTCNRDYRCMKKITVEEVINAVERSLGYEHIIA